MHQNISLQSEGSRLNSSNKVHSFSSQFFVLLFSFLFIIIDYRILSFFSPPTYFSLSFHQESRILKSPPLKESLLLQSPPCRVLNQPLAVSPKLCQSLFHMHITDPSYNTVPLSLLTCVFGFDLLPGFKNGSRAPSDNGTRPEARPSKVR